MNKHVKKLVLNRETVRSLQDSDLAHVVGGGPRRLDVGQLQAVKLTVMCPCGSTCTDSGGGSGLAQAEAAGFAEGGFVLDGAFARALP